MTVCIGCRYTFSFFATCFSTATGDYAKDITFIVSTFTLPYATFTSHNTSSITIAVVCTIYACISSLFSSVFLFFFILLVLFLFLYLYLHILYILISLVRLLMKLCFSVLRCIDCAPEGMCLRAL